MPATMKYQTAEVRKLDRGTKKETMSHRMMADMLREMNEPVMAFDATSPRRIRIWEMAKQTEAWMAKYSAIRENLTVNRRPILGEQAFRP